MNGLFVQHEADQYGRPWVYRAALDADGLLACPGCAMALTYDQQNAEPYCAGCGHPLRELEGDAPVARAKTDNEDDEPGGYDSNAGNDYDGASYRDNDGFRRCVNCEAVINENHNFCPHCGSKLKPYDFGQGNETRLAGADAEVRETPGGRVPLSSGSPGARRALLESLDTPVTFSRYLDGPGDDWISRVSAAEELALATERDLQDAHARLRESRREAGYGRYPAERARTAEAVEDYAAFVSAEARYERALRAHEAAQDRLARLEQQAPPGLGG
jgi:Double zinc ribbon